MNEVTIWRDNVPMTPAHLSKAQDIPLSPGDRVEVRTPGGGGYGPPDRRDPLAVAHDLAMGYYSEAEVRALFAPRHRG